MADDELAELRLEVTRLREIVADLSGVVIALRRLAEHRAFWANPGNPTWNEELVGKSPREAELVFLQSFFKLKFVDITDDDDPLLAAEIEESAPGRTDAAAEATLLRFREQIPGEQVQLPVASAD